MPTLSPYLSFDGNCEEAFNFYRLVFRKEFKYLGRYKDVPGTDRQLFADDDDKIMHVSLPIGEHAILMGSDSRSSSTAQGDTNNFALYVNAESREEADRLFNELSAGGQIKVSMTETFWGSYYGIFRDKFGIHWKITFDLPGVTLPK